MRYKIKFELRNSSSNKKPIRCRISIPKDRIEFNVGISVLEKDWDTIHERVKKTNKNYQNINSQLFNIEEVVFKYLTLASINNQCPNKKEISALLHKTTDNKNNLIDIFNQFIKEVTLKKNLTKSTIFGYNATRDKLISTFPNIKINEITDNTLQKMIDILVSEDRNNSSIEQTIIRIKAFLKWAKKKNLYTNNADQFECKLKGIGYREIIYLEWEELNKLMQVETYNKTEKHTLDLFIFSCFTGLRYSDIVHFTKGNIQNNKIHITSQKTNTTTTIELNNFSKAILLKYDYVLPYVPAIETSKTIRELAKRANINAEITTTHYCGKERVIDTQPKYQVLTFHAARRTFVTTALSIGIPSEVIMKWTGHKNFTTLKHYAEIVNSLKEENMQKFNEKLKK